MGSTILSFTRRRRESSIVKMILVEMSIPIRVLIFLVLYSGQGGQRIGGVSISSTSLRSDMSLDELSRMLGPIVRGWISYYGSFYKSALYPILRHLNRILVRWAMRKFKRFRRHHRRAEYWLGEIAQRQPRLFPHWQMGVRPMAG